MAEPLVEVLIEDARWKATHLEEMARGATAATLAQIGLSPADFSISLLGCDDARISALNGDFRQKARPTNVLSWPAREARRAKAGAAPELPVHTPGTPPQELGDIAISYDTCAREAREAGKPLAAHVRHLIVHATLHLLGYDHILEQDAHLMEDLERATLASMGDPDPYEIT